MKFSKIKKKAFLILTAFSLMTVWFVVPKKTNHKEAVPTFAVPPAIDLYEDNKKDEKTNEKPLLNLPNPDINRMKSQGCVADGLLSGYNRSSKDIKVINDSECYYLHRALETWLDAPDFDEVEEIKEKIDKKDILYGMFIAEAINKKENYYFKKEDRKFDFSKMCRDGSKNYWGEHTCKPSFSTQEYRDYVQQITEDAIDSGIQVFMFGQVFYQEENVDNPKYTREVVKNMRDYAETRGVKIVIGAQTNNIKNEDYLRIFDFIEGGVGLHASGEVEDQPCFSRWWNPTSGGWCWALLWHERYKSKANNVFVHLDWSGVIGDDMSTFSRMDENERHSVLQSLHDKFVSQDVGFLMPVLTPLPKNNGGCHGPKKNFYSPSMKYGCKDLDAINGVLSEVKGKVLSEL